MGWILFRLILFITVQMNLAQNISLPKSLEIEDMKDEITGQVNDYLNKINELKAEVQEKLASWEKSFEERLKLERLTVAHLISSNTHLKSVKNLLDNLKNQDVPAFKSYYKELLEPSAGLIEPIINEQIENGKIIYTYEANRILVLIEDLRLYLIEKSKVLPNKCKSFRVNKCSIGDINYFDNSIKNLRDEIDSLKDYGDFAGNLIWKNLNNLTDIYVLKNIVKPLFSRLPV